MKNVGQTLFRLCGALLLAAGATRIDNPRTVDPAGVRPIAARPVVIAANDIPEGTALDRAAIAVALWPVGTQPAGAYATMDSVAGRVARVTIYKGEVILPGRLAPEGTEAGLQVKITPGKRAYGIRVSDMSSLAAMIRPNSRVDIMVVIDDPEQPGKRVAKLFMSNMRVLAIGPIEAAAATIEVSPEEAERLAVAASQGQIHLVLRGYGDPDSVRTLGRPMPNVMRLSRPDSLSVRVIRGTPPR